MQIIFYDHVTVVTVLNAFVVYLDDWEKEVAEHRGLSKKDQRKMCLSRKTLLDLRITGNSQAQ